MGNGAVLVLYENVAIAEVRNETGNAFQLVALFQKHGYFFRVKGMDFSRSLTPFLRGLCKHILRLSRAEVNGAVESNCPQRALTAAQKGNPAANWELRRGLGERVTSFPG